MITPQSLYVSLIILSLCTLLLSCSNTNEDNLAEEIISMERIALNRWGRGDTQGFLEISSDEITYFDTGTERRIDGIEALKELYKPREGKIKIDHYDMINPKVQVHGGTAVLTFNLIDYEPIEDGSFKETHWNATEIYSKINGEWKIIHTHWSFTKPCTENTN